MNKEINSARSNKKLNHPILKDITIPLEKRTKFIGIGGYNLKKIFTKTGFKNLKMQN